MKAHSLLLIACMALPLSACDKQGDAPANENTATENADAADAKKAGDNAADAKKAGDKAGDKKDLHDAFTDLSPDDLQKLVNDKGCVPVDANGSSTREKYGVVPGAVLLSGSDFKTSELPEDKNAKLVFYCGGKACMAAPKAAKVAKEAGYEDVNVMRVGIRGWVDAGKKVDKPAT